MEKLDGKVFNANEGQVNAEEAAFLLEKVVVSRVI